MMFWKIMVFSAVALNFSAGAVWAADPTPTIVVTSPDQHWKVEKPWDARFPAKLIDTRTGRVAFEFPMRWDIYSFAFNKDSSKLAAMPRLENLSYEILNAISTEAAPLDIVDLHSWKLRRLHFGEQILPRGNAVKNTANPILEWNADSSKISIDIEEGQGIGIVLDVQTGKVLATLGRISGRVEAEARLPVHVRWEFDPLPMSYQAWRDLEGDPVTALAWSPRDPALLAVSYEDGKIAFIDFSKPENDPNSKVDVSRLIKSAPMRSSTRIRYGAQRQIKWSPDGRYLAMIQYDKLRLSNQAVITIFDTANAAVVKRAALTHSFEDELGKKALNLEWDASGLLQVRSGGGSLKFQTRLSMNRVPGGNICETALRKIGFVQRLIQKKFYKF